MNWDLLGATRSMEEDLTCAMHPVAVHRCVGAAHPLHHRQWSIACKVHAKARTTKLQCSRHKQHVSSLVAPPRLHPQVVQPLAAQTSLHRLQCPDWQLSSRQRVLHYSFGLACRIVACPQSKEAWQGRLAASQCRATRARYARASGRGSRGTSRCLRNQQLWPGFHRKRAALAAAALLLLRLLLFLMCLPFVC